MAGPERKPALHVYGGEEVIVLSRWLVTGHADGVGDLREVTNLVEQDVRRELPPEHRERRAVFEREGDRLARASIVKCRDESTKVAANAVPKFV